MRLGPCAKVEVRARLVSADGLRMWEADNSVRNPQRTCPRQGEEAQRDRYALCRDICGQPAHAEIRLLHMAGPRAKGATLFVAHKRICDDCRKQAERAGVARIVVEAAI